MKTFRLTVGDIMVSKVLYYDPDRDVACKQVCEKLYIDYLPGVDGKHYYQYESGQYIKKEITVRYRLNIDQLLFDKRMPARFSRNGNNVLFVYEGEVLRGLAHISDFNQNIVLQALQDDVLTFERNIRYLLGLYGFDNSHMLRYFHYKRDQSSPGSKKYEFWKNKLNTFDKRDLEMSSLRPFQLFDFSDLLMFSSSSESKKVFQLPALLIGKQKHAGIKILCDLRNMAMHGKDPVSRGKVRGLYTLVSLRMLFHMVYYLRDQHLLLLGKVRSHEDYVKSMEIDNRLKLDIIHEHFPKALEYFIRKE